MEERYIENQNLFNKTIKSITDGVNNVHAFLLVSDDNEILRKSSMILCKSIVCPLKYKINCNSCNICKRIDDGNFDELIVVNPVNNLIKKEEIDNIKDKFSTYSLEGKKQVYIINKAECLNSTSANKLLKFLEEPESNTVAILTCSNLNNVIDTIVSRCQIIKLEKSKKTGFDFIKFFSNIEDENKLNKYLDIIKDIEKEKKKYLININKEYLKIFDGKEDLEGFMKLSLLYYKDILNYIIFGSPKYFSKEDYRNINIYNKQEISKKILFITENIEKINYNISMNLFMINYIFGIGDV